jgi:hypothetical protein
MKARIDTGRQFPLTQPFCHDARSDVSQRARDQGSPQPRGNDRALPAVPAEDRGSADRRAAWTAGTNDGTDEGERTGGKER